MGILSIKIAALEKEKFLVIAEAYYFNETLLEFYQNLNYGS